MAKTTSHIDRDKIYDDLRNISSTGNSEHFIEDFMKAYHFSSTAIAKIKKGIEKSSANGCLIQKKSFYFKQVSSGEVVENCFENALSNTSPSERFIIVTDFKKFMARDNKTKMNICVEFNQLAEQYEFFLPLCGIEKHQDTVENVADVKAAQKMAELFDEIKKDNLDNAEWNLTDKNLTEAQKKRIEHNYAHFFTRLLFCLFADDTHIFEDNQFQAAIEVHTDEDGTNVASWLKGLFEVLDLPNNRRLGISHSYIRFPYVNGGLFKDNTAVPTFTYKSRKKLLECCASDWSQINPDIFGSMFQGVISVEKRSELGQHYTSVSNIMKVIKPLFLDELYEELNQIKGNDKKLDAFRLKLSKIKIFDPACGSGNFLIIAYKELCRLEMEALDSYANKPLPFLSILLENFYGIEIDEFPCEVARLSLWLAQHQINLECYNKYGNSNPTLPLSPTGNIVCGNACRLDWEEVCPSSQGEQIYICGNPPFLGGSYLNESQKEDRLIAFGRYKVFHGYIDYVAAWFILAAKQIEKNKQIRVSFVSTNSVNQGLISGIWNYIWDCGVEISFAYEPFKWKNNAMHNAGVTVTIIGLRAISTQNKYLISGTVKRTVKNINNYLSDSPNIVVVDNDKIPIGLPKASFGSKFSDGGNLIMSTTEKEELVQQYPQCKAYIHKVIGAEEYINGKTRWCIWICSENEYKYLDSIPPIHNRIEKVRTMRLASKAPSTRKQGETPWKPVQVCYSDEPAIIIPRTSSENRIYIPIGYLEKGTVINDNGYALYGATLWLFALLTSKLHMLWTKTVCGYLGTSIRYSNTLAYNNFPFPTLSDAQKAQLETSAIGILMARENHYDITLAQQYDPDNMPADLREAHNANDLLVDSLFRKSGFASDEERLSELFKRYKKLVEEAK